MIELDGDAIGFKFGPQFSYFVINLGREKRPANNIHVCIYIYIYLTYFHIHELDIQMDELKEKKTR